MPSARPGIESDEELLASYVREGDAGGFAELYRRFEARLYGFFMRRLPISQRALASDLFQKTWLKVHKGRARFNPSERFAPWFFSIALNVLRDEWRLSTTRMEVFDGDEGTFLDHPDPRADLEEKLSLKQDLARTETALLDLPDAQREALLLSDWEGFSSREVAEVLKVSDASARQLVSRARRKVRLALRGNDDGKQ